MLFHSKPRLPLSHYSGFCNSVGDGILVLSVFYLLPAIISTGEEKAHTHTHTETVSQVYWVSHSSAEHGLIF